MCGTSIFAGTITGSLSGSDFKRKYTSASFFFYLPFLIGGYSLWQMVVQLGYEVQPKKLRVLVIMYCKVEPVR